MTSAYLVRHAHAHWEPSEERPLSEQGSAGARALADCMGATAVSAIYSSPARRAIETIQPLAAARGLVPEIVPDLRERALVVPSGATFESAVETAWLDPAAAADGTESNRAAAERGVGVLQRILAKHRGEPVVMSTHGNLLALILGALNSSYGYETWRALTFPDVYRLVFQGKALVDLERVWVPPAAEE